MNFNTNNKILILVGVFVVMVVASFVFLSNDSIAPDSNNVQPTTTPSPTAKATSKPTAAKQSQIYTQLVKEYEGRRIQFDAMCQAIPNNVTYKNGTSIMLDNRSGDARYISVSETKYYVAGYGYKIVTLSSSALPKTLLLSCGAAVNVGQILLQK